MLIVLSFSLVLNLEPHVVVNVKVPQLKDPVGAEIQPLLHLLTVCSSMGFFCLEEEYFFLTDTQILSAHPVLSLWST